MNSFFRHIEYLLLRHDCVIVPGLGAFIATRIPARMDFGNGLILPPSRSLMFNQAVALDDGLLANSIARKSGVSFEDARQIIVRYVSSVKESLAADGEVRIGNLGSLLLNGEGKLLFAPDRIDFSSTSEMGYVTVNLTRGLGNGEMVSDDDDSVGGIDTASIAERRHRLRIGKAFARVAAMAALMVAVALTVILNPLPSDQREQRASVVPVKSISRPVQAEPVASDTAKAGETIAEAPVEQVAPAHYLIVATFSNAKEANSYAERFSTEEFPLTAVESRRLTRVAVAASDNMDELRKKLNSSAISSRFPNAWIWSRD